MAYTNNNGQTRIGVRIVPQVNASSLWNSIYSVYNADTIASSSLKTSLVASYNGESNANDSFGSTNGTAQGGLTYGVGKVGTAFQFNGSNSYVALPTNIFKKTGDFSFSLWVNANALSGSQAIFGTYFYDGTIYGWRLDFSNSGMNFGIFGSSHVNLGISGTFNNGQWYHITVTRKASTGTKVYVNGTLNVSNTSTINPNYATTQYTTIGATQYQPSTVTYYFNGKIDGVNVWDKELTASEITELYNSGNGKQYPN